MLDQSQLKISGADCIMLTIISPTDYTIAITYF